MTPDRRGVNEYRRRAFGDRAERVVAFVCECADEQCRRAVLLTPVQYDEARAAGRALVVDSAHEPPTADSPRR